MLVLKFFLHVSKEEQRQRLLARLEEPDKRWKFSMNDIAERKLWGKYMAAYEQIISDLEQRFDLANQNTLFGLCVHQR